VSQNVTHVTKNPCIHQTYCTPSYKFTHISTYTTEVLHFPIASRIKFLVSGLPWLNVVLLLSIVPPLRIPSLSYYERSLCLAYPLHPVALLKRFFSLRSFRAESASD